MNNTTKIQYEQFDDFTKAYIEAALWAETDNADESGGEPLDANYDETHIHEDSLQSIYEDCKKFQHENACLWEDKDTDSGWSIDQQAGHDFWLTRCSHGVGFFDRKEIYGETEIEMLDKAATDAGGIDIEVGDDGKLYF